MSIDASQHTRRTTRKLKPADDQVEVETMLSVGEEIHEGCTILYTPLDNGPLTLYSESNSRQFDILEHRIVCPSSDVPELLKHPYIWRDPEYITK